MYLHWNEFLHPFHVALVESGPPTNVTLRALNNHTILMTWNPPEPLPNASKIAYNYVIHWSVDAQAEEDVFITLSQNYTFEDLQLGQSLTAAVRAISPDGKYGGRLSEIQNLTLPGEGSSSLAYDFPYCLILFVYSFIHVQSNNI